MPLVTQALYGNNHLEGCLDGRQNGRMFGGQRVFDRWAGALVKNTPVQMKKSCTDIFFSPYYECFWFLHRNRGKMCSTMTRRGEWL